MKRRKVIGYNFRDRSRSYEPLPVPDLRIRTASRNDIGLITSHSDGIFETHEIKDIPFWISRGSIRIFEDAEGEFVGYGMFNRTVEEKDWFDIGMYVNPDHRKKGYGTWIIDRLANTCIEKGWRPTAGCAFENTASKKTLERSGFVSKHLIVEFWN